MLTELKPLKYMSLKLPKHIQHMFGSNPSLTVNPVLLTAEVPVVFTSTTDNSLLLSTISVAVLLLLDVVLLDASGWGTFHFLVLLFTPFNCSAF